MGGTSGHQASTTGRGRQLGTLTFLATAAGGTPQVIVMDEFPYLVEQDPSLETTLQKVWDRYLGEAPVLLVLIGSDISMMSALTEYDRPLYGRPTLEIVVEPFGPHETAEVLGFSAADAIDAQLVLGGVSPDHPGPACLEAVISHLLEARSAGLEPATF